jgi:sterol 3beta-glucosyltransferase
VRHPYLGAKQEGPLGFGKGVGRGLGGLFFHSHAGESTRNMLKGTCR